MVSKMSKKNFAALTLTCLIALSPGARSQSMSKYALDNPAPDCQLVLSGGDKVALASQLEKNRIILLFVPPSYETEAEHYLEHLKSQESSLKERDLIVYAVAAPDSPLQKGSFGENVKVASNCDPMPTSLSPNFDNGPLFVLVGKDKTIKLREMKFVSEKALFNVIDAMPMRKAEMKRH